MARRRLAKENRNSSTKHHKPPNKTIEDRAQPGLSKAGFDHHVAILSDKNLSLPANVTQRVSIMRQLQESHGNRYVQRVVQRVQEIRRASVQAKLTVGPAGDEYEKEADQVSREVVGMTDQSAQRQGPEEEELQMQSVQRQEEEEELQMLPVQRQEEEELQMKPARQMIGPEGGQVDSDMEGEISKAKSRGQALPDDIRTDMEGAFGSDFSGVRIHDDGNANSLNESINARAFTAGQDIFFRQGDYRPASREGQETIAHELTHVVQQGGASRLPVDEDPAVQALQRHSVEDAAEEEELIQQKKLSSSEAIQRKSDEEIKTEFQTEYDDDNKTKAVNVLKDEYNLDAKPYDLSVEELPRASTHASTGGGWNRAEDNFTDIRVRVNEPYLDRQAGSDAGYTKLLHTLGHEYQHVEQRSEKGWRATDNTSAKGEREFKAYSWEVLDAKNKNKIPEMGKANTLSAIRKAKKYYATMSDVLKETHQVRYNKLVAIETDLNE